MGDLFSLSRQCLQGFEQLNSRLADAKPEYAVDMPPRAMQSALGKFRVWCGNLGALEAGYLSLEYRLRESPVLQSAMFKLLRQLSSALDESIAVASGDRLPFELQPKPADLSEDSTDESDIEEDPRPTKELVMRVSSITDCLNSLYRLGYQVRNLKLEPSVVFHETDSETNADLLNRFTQLDMGYVFRTLRFLRQGKPVPEDFPGHLLPRLSAAISHRRRCFKYWQRYSKQSSHGKGPASKPPSLDFFDMHIHSKLETRGASAPEAAGQISHPLPWTTFVSKPNEMPGDPLPSGNKGKEPALSLPSTALDAEGNGLDLPDPPLEALRGEDFTCPYCCVLCPAEQGRGDMWKQHVLYDMQPYICTYRNCLHPNELYRSRSQWIEHEASVHRRRWRCYDHPDVLYSSSDELRHHLATEHSRKLSSKQMDELAYIYSFCSADHRECCPICFQRQPFENGIENHLADHLEQLFMFPWRPNPPEMQIHKEEVMEVERNMNKAQAASHGPSSPSESLTYPDSLLQRFPVAFGKTRKRSSLERMPFERMPLERMPSKIVFHEGIAQLRVDVEGISQDTLHQRAQKLRTGIEQDPPAWKAIDTRPPLPQVSLPALYKELLGALFICPFTRNKFLPRDALNEKITIESIRANDSTSSLSIDLVRQVVLQARKLFAILVLIDSESCIEDLLSSGITDESIPFPNKGPLDTGGFQATRVDGSVFTACQDWPLHRVNELLDMQWIVQAPVFDTSGTFATLGRSCGLPLFKTSCISSGHCHQVWECVVHPAHYKGDSQVQAGPIVVVVKEFTNPVAFHRENDHLTKLHRFNDPHLIRHLASCIIDSSSSYIIFPLARGRNLQVFWRRKNRTSRSRDFCLWSLRQMLGLAGALSTLHRSPPRSFYDHHGNLQPSSILIFGDNGDHSLVISGLGNWRPDPPSATCLQYEAPELFEQESKSQMGDVWSLGCIFLEFVVWLLGGCDGIENYRAKRQHSGRNPHGSFYMIADGERVSSPEVAEGVRDLCNNLLIRDETSLEALVRLVSEKLLVMEPQDRYTATQLRDHLERIVHQAEQSPKELRNLNRGR